MTDQKNEAAAPAGLNSQDTTRHDQQPFKPVEKAKITVEAMSKYLAGEQVEKDSELDRVVASVKAVLGERGAKSALRQLASIEEIARSSDRLQKEDTYRAYGRFSLEEDAAKVESLDDPNTVETAKERMKKISMIQAGLELIALNKSGTEHLTAEEKERFKTEFGLTDDDVSKSIDEIINAAMDELYLQTEKGFFSFLAGETDPNSRRNKMRVLCTALPELRDNLQKAVGRWRVETMRAIGQKPPESPQREKRRLEREILGDEGNDGELKSFLRDVLTDEVFHNLGEEEIKALINLIRNNPNKAQSTILEMTKKEVKNNDGSDFANLILKGRWVALVEKVNRIKELERPDPKSSQNLQRGEKEYEDRVTAALTELDKMLDRVMTETYDGVLDAYDKQRQAYLEEQAKKAAEQGKMKATEYYLNSASYYIAERGIGQPKDVYLDRIRRDIMILKNAPDLEMAGQYLIAQKMGLIGEFPPIALEIPIKDIRAAEILGKYVVRDKIIFMAYSPLDVPDELWDQYREKLINEGAGSLIQDTSNRSEWFVKNISENPTLKEFLKANPGAVQKEVNDLFAAYLRAKDYIDKAGGWLKSKLPGRPEVRFIGDKKKFALKDDELMDVLKKYGTQFKKAIEDNKEAKRALEQVKKDLGMREINMSLIIKILLAIFGVGATAMLIKLGFPAILGLVGSLGGMMEGVGGKKR